MPGTWTDVSLFSAGVRNAHTCSQLPQLCDLLERVLPEVSIFACYTPGVSAGQTRDNSVCNAVLHTRTYTGQCRTVVSAHQPMIPQCCNIAKRINKLIAGSNDQIINQTINRSANQSINHPTNQSTNQPINQPANQSINQPTNRSTSHPPTQVTHNVKGHALLSRLEPGTVVKRHHGSSNCQVLRAACS